MKKYISILVIVMLVVGCLFGCGNSEESKDGSDDDSNRINIMTTIFPEYDWVRNIVGESSENVEVSMLLDNGVDLHSYQPTAEDIMKISTCDMFIYVGGESDEWVADALKESTNPDMIVINLLEVLGDASKTEEVIEGMEDHDHEDDHDDEDDHASEDHDHEDHDHESLDEHVWLSLKNAEVLINEIADTIQKLDSEHAETYKQNAENYIEEIRALDSEYAETIAAAPNKTLVFGDRFPFRYLVDDYGLTYYAAFVGCAAETEASFETITFLAEKVDEQSIGYVLAIEGSDGRIADTVINSTKTKTQKRLMLDSMQSVTKGDVANGATYISIMKKNLEVLKEALY